MPKWSDLTDLVGNLLTPASAEAKVLYQTPAVQRLGEDIAGGRVQEAGAPVQADPAVLAYMQQVLRRAQRIPQEAYVGEGSEPGLLGVTDVDIVRRLPDVAGRTNYSPRPGAPTMITMTPEGMQVHPQQTLAHELSHFLMNYVGQRESDYANMRQHAITDAMFSADPDKEKVITQSLKKAMPQESEDGSFFQEHKANTMDLYNRFMKSLQE